MRVVEPGGLLAKATERAAATAGMSVVAIPSVALPPEREALALADVVLDSIEALDPSSSLACTD